ncbi:Ig-like domain-containing protein, partial [Flavobacterium sp. LC2016-12]|uniref:Ig-like domain-containing protein n=1 Tax=Flavobacterium sp. LC2016-12 TaxID=2783794 RepID=UPI00188DA1E3
NDTDVDLDALTVVAGTFTTTQGGTLTLAADGSYTYMPAANFNGIDTLNYTVSDGTLTDVGTLTITVTKANDAPVAVDDIITAIEDTLFTSTINLTANDTDIDLEALTVVAGTFTTTQGGTFTLAADGSYTYMPAVNFHGIDTVNYTVSDGILTDIGTLTITVTPVNDAPLAVDDTNSTDEDITLTVAVNSPHNLLANDTDADGDILTVSQFAIGSTIYTIGSTANLIEGALTINANGSYVFVPKPDYNGSVPKVIYTITDGTNSMTANLFITVNPVNELLIINDDTASSIVGSNQATTILNVLGNDTKGGLPIVISEVTITETVVDPTGFIKLNSDGTIVLKANAPAGTYNLTYQVCELNTTNCATATVTISVIAPVIDAVKETTAPINGTIGGTTTSLVSNDTLNGIAVVIGINPGQVSLSPVSVPNGLTLNADGSIKIDAGTPAGTYHVEYKICEVNNPTNCDSVISEVIVTAGVLQANNDIIGSVVGVNQPITLVNVFANDTNNSLPVVASDMILSVITEDPTGFITLNSDGTAILGANAPAGTYELIYQICEKLNPTNCSSASIKVTVIAPTMTVTANSYCSNDVPYVSYTVAADNFTPNSLLTINWIDSENNVVATQTNLPLTGNVLWPGAIVDNNGIGIDWPGWLLTNGQWVEGADGFENTRTGVTMQFSLNPTVNVVVNYPPATPQCNARPTFVIKANNDTAGPIDSDKGQSATIDIFDNDTLNGSVVNPANVVLSTVVASPNLDLKADGSIEIKPGTPTGNYQLTYQICDALNLSNCSQAIVTVSVVNVTDPDPPTPVKQIVATNDTATSVDGINGELEFINVLDNDLLNGIKINPDDIVISNIPQSAYFEFNSDGTVNVKPNTPGGSYILIYRICEKTNLSNCVTAALNVFVEVPAIAIIKTAIFNDENGNGVANASETISYKFKVTNTGNVPLVGIVITDALPGIMLSGQAINLAVNESDETNFSAQYKITQDDINRGSVSNQATVKGQSGRGVVVEDKSDDSSNLEDKPTVLPLNGCLIKVNNAFSPNGDSKNSRFYIQGLECYPDNTVEIYNRWGVLVYDIDHYNNEDRAFIGISAGRATIKETDGLPVGTYFYILKYKDSESKPHELSGYLYINK